MNVKTMLSSFAEQVILIDFESEYEPDISDRTLMSG